MRVNIFNKRRSQLVRTKVLTCNFNNFSVIRPIASPRAFNIRVTNRADYYFSIYHVLRYAEHDEAQLYLGNDPRRDTVLTAN